MDLLTATDVVKDFQAHRALDKVSVSVPEGSIFGLLGPNGAGKTTLIRIINQITAPDTGTVTLKGRPLSREDIYRIGYLPEERGLYKKMKVGEHAIYLARLKGISSNDARKKLKYWFEKFEIGDWWNKKIEELSKGMQQKIQFITTVIHEPELLIFDEPFSGFDPINVNLLKKEILKLRDDGATIIFSTHNMSSVEELCDHITLINDSRTILEGEVNQIRNKFSSDIISVGFEGDPSALEKGLDRKFEILTIKENGIGKEARIKLASDAKQNELITALAGLTDIKSYNEVLPSMNDIFIQVVESASPKNKKAS